MPVELEVIARIIFWGLIAGAIYTLLAIGLNVIFGVMKVVNFAHGELMVVGGYITFYLWESIGLNPYTIIPASMAAVALLGILVERLAFRPIKGTSKLNEIFLSLAIILILQNVMAQAALLRLKELKPVIVVSPYRLLHFEIGTVRLPFDFVVILTVTGALLLFLFLMIYKTGFGRRIRAVSQNRLAAAMLGINVERIDALSFGLGAALASVAGSFLAVLTPFDPYSGTFPAIKAFAIIILGGLGSVEGALVAGFILGLSESFAGFLLGGAWKDAIAFALLAAILIVRPEGIFGEKA